MNKRSPQLRLIELARSKFWLTPGLIVIGSSLLVLFLELVEIGTDSFLMLFVRGEGPNIEAARLILSSIATALMTVISVLFSITIVVLQQVSSQYSPRVIENFIRSRLSQIVLGLYIGTFCFSLLCLLLIRSREDGMLLPKYQVAVSLAVFLSMACLALLIFYIHHIVKSIKSNHILLSIREDTLKALWHLDADLKHLTPAQDGEANRTQWKSTYAVHSLQTGYLQEVHWHNAAEVMKRRDCFIKTRLVVGDFVYKGTLLAEVLTVEPISKKGLHEVGQLFSVHIEQTYSQDPRYGVRQLTDIALRALSPGINDPSTAIEAVNEIGSVLAEYTKAQIKPVCMRSGESSFLSLDFPSYAQVVGLCFDQIIASGREFYALLLQVHTALGHCQALATDEEHCRILKLYERQVKVLIDELNHNGPLQLIDLSQSQLEQ